MTEFVWTQIMENIEINGKILNSGEPLKVSELCLWVVTLNGSDSRNIL